MKTEKFIVEFDGRLSEPDEIARALRRLAGDVLDYGVGLGTRDIAMRDSQGNTIGVAGSREVEDAPPALVKAAHNPKYQVWDTITDTPTGRTFDTQEGADRACRRANKCYRPTSPRWAARPVGSPLDVPPPPALVKVATTENGSTLWDAPVPVPTAVDKIANEIHAMRELGTREAENQAGGLIRALELVMGTDEARDALGEHGIEAH